MQTSIWEMLAMILYLVLVVGVGVYFFVKSKSNDNGEKEYFLGGRNMGGWVARLDLPFGHRSDLDFGRTFNRYVCGVDFYCAETSQIFDPC